MGFKQARHLALSPMFSKEIKIERNVEVYQILLPKKKHLNYFETLFSLEYSIQIHKNGGLNWLNIHL
jgi:hypothetical protein